MNVNGDCTSWAQVKNREESEGQFDVMVYGQTVVREHKTHVRISRDDWEKIKSVIIPLLKQGDVKHATGNNEGWKQETNYASK